MRPSLYNNIDNIKGNSCVTSCSKVDKTYADEKKININECPNNKNYVIKKFTHNEKDTQHKQMKREKNEC